MKCTPRTSPTRPALLLGAALMLGLLLLATRPVLAAEQTDVAQATPPAPAPTPLPAAESAATSTTAQDPAAVTVLVDRLRLRTGPGPDSPVLARAFTGDVLTVEGQSQACSWLLVRTDDGTLGWVSGSAELVSLNVPCETLPASSRVLPTPTLMPTATPTTAPSIATTAGASRTPVVRGRATPVRTTAPTPTATATPPTTATPPATATPTRTPPPTNTPAAPELAIRPGRFPPRIPTPIPFALQPTPPAEQPAADPLTQMAMVGPTRVDTLFPASGLATRERIAFSWVPDQPLAPGQVFEVAFWRKGESPDFGIGWTSATTESYLAAKTYEQTPGLYFWGVWLGTYVDGAYYRLRYLGGGNQLTVVPEPEKEEGPPPPSDCPPSAPCRP